jgi:hypothetical protein
MSAKLTSSPALPVALLSTATADTGGSISLAIDGGETILAHQIAALRHIGISSFLIEVDTVPGVLIALADKIRDKGCRVDFIRSAHDLQDKLGLDETLLVNEEGVFIAPELISSILAKSGSFIATVDGRDENANFERMDLNTRWAGLAVFGKETIAGLGSVPDGWSISSSLLRQAMQDGVPMRAVKQTHIQQGDLRKISSPADIEILTKQILLNRSARERGFIESVIFGPAVTRLVPLVWRSASGLALLGGATVMTAAVSFGFAALGWTGIASASALVAIFMNSVFAVAHDPGLDGGAAKWIGPVIWSLLAIAVLMAVRNSGYQIVDGIFSGAIMVGLALLSRQLRLPEWAEKILVSPALIAILILFLTLFSNLAQATKWISLVQLALLITAKWSYKPRT